MNKQQECINIYREAFGDEDTVFEKKLFDNCFCHCRYLEKDGKVATMLFALPCEIITKENTFPAVYIYAAASLKKFRGKGYMTELLEKVKARCNSVFFLRPANESLIAFYEKCGFKTVKAVCSNEGFPLVKPTGSFAELTKDITDFNCEEFTAMYFSNENINIDNLHFIYSME